MSEITLFDYNDYRDYLEFRLKTSQMGRGGKAKLASHLSCQPSFVSQVLKGKSSFSLEQAFKINDFFSHNPLQKEFFMILVEKDRAGTMDLKNYFAEKQKELIEKSKLVENQMEYDQLSDADAVAYYSHWNAILIRNTIEIQGCNDKPSLQNRLGLSDEDIDEALNFLIDKKLIRWNENKKLTQGHTRLHIKKGSPIAKSVNILFRYHMLKLMQKSNKNSLNYGCYMTLPRSSYELFQKKLRALIVEMNTHLEEEEGADMVALMNLDFMELT